ncbi:hypothetical protein ATR01nite_17280 [Acetobacter tropicalis]|uniref:Uncharacterized protein n=1 Tax=Acetobacter tropicalis TaxID=104102 RepID=A0A511FNX4_9PROT|nr:hypothetical protein ATR01nite_17280 [Acetobacter tropicalis]
MGATRAGREAGVTHPVTSMLVRIPHTPPSPINTGEGFGRIRVMPEGRKETCFFIEERSAGRAERS